MINQCVPLERSKIIEEKINIDQESFETIVQVEPRNQLMELIENEISPSQLVDTKSDANTEDSFYDNLFTTCSETDSYCVVPADSFAFTYESDNESEIEENPIKFYIHSQTSVFAAEYKNDKYNVGFLDLTENERASLAFAAQVIVSLNIAPSDIVIEFDKLYVKRIRERNVKPNLRYDHYAKELNVDRVHFSSSEPLLSKYKNGIYFVGERLHAEYKELLQLTKKRIGIPIRLNNERIIIDTANQTLDVTKTYSYINQRICVISGSHNIDENIPHGCEEIQRFLISVELNEMKFHKINEKLIHSSAHDDCTEIYAEIDFPWNPRKSGASQLRMSGLRGYPVPEEISNLLSDDNPPAELR